MIRRPPRSTRKESSAASDVYKRQANNDIKMRLNGVNGITITEAIDSQEIYDSVDKSHNRYNFGKKCEDILWMRDRPIDRTPTWIENNANIFYNNIF